MREQTDIQIGHAAMTDHEIYEAGKDGFRRGWSNIPPYSIAMIKRDLKKQPSAATIWQDGWSHARADAHPHVEEEAIEIPWDEEQQQLLESSMQEMLRVDY